MDLDEFLSLPIDSMVTVQCLTGPHRFLETVFHRTGKNGWLITRSIEGLKIDSYNNEDAIRTALSVCTDLTFNILRYGPGTSKRQPPPPRFSTIETPREDPHEFMRFGAGADYRHSCAECLHPRRHEIHGLEPGLEREPEVPPRDHRLMPTPASVRACYGSLMDTLDEYNEGVPAGDEVMLPFTLQYVLAAYIEEQEVIALLKGEK